MKPISSRLAQLRQFLEASPEDTFILFAIAKEYEYNGDDAEALAHYRKLIEVDENYVGAYYHLGKLYEKGGEPVQALSVYDKGMEVARSIGDQHALSELAGAKLQLEE